MSNTGFRIDTMRAQNPRYSGERVSAFRTWDTKRCPPVYSNLFISYNDGHWSSYDWTLNYTSMIKPSGGYSATKIIDYGGTIEYIPSLGYSCCYDLSYVLLPNCHTLYDQAFRVCGLTEIVMPDLRRIHNLCFEACTLLTSVNAPKCSYVGDNAFDRCASITSLVLSEQVYVENNGLSPILLSNYNKLPSQMVLKSSNAVHTTVLEALSEPNKCYNAKVTDGVLQGSYYGLLSEQFGVWRVRSIDMPNAWYIGNKIMEGQSLLTTVNLPEAKYIGLRAFYNCSQLTSFSGSKIKEIGQSAFYGCKSLYELDLPMVSDIQAYAFQNCYNLRDIYFRSDKIVRLLYSSEGLFNNCHSELTLHVPSSLYSEYVSAYQSGYVTLSLRSERVPLSTLFVGDL